jgi:hypothetical protein
MASFPVPAGQYAVDANIVIQNSSDTAALVGDLGAFTPQLFGPPFGVEEIIRVPGDREFNRYGFVRRGLGRSVDDQPVLPLGEQLPGRLRVRHSPRDPRRRNQLIGLAAGHEFPLTASVISGPVSLRLLRGRGLENRRPPILSDSAAARSFRTSATFPDRLGGQSRF